jgi:SPP1 gp7 family putative phage head morphogenesis protein
VPSVAYKAIEDIANDAEFWRGIQGRVALRMGNVAGQVVAEGVRSAAVRGAIADMDELMPVVIRLAKETSNVYWGKIVDTTRAAIQEAVAAWLETGIVTPEQQMRGLPTLIQGLEQMFEPVRAQRIAVTEVTRLFAAGVQAGGDSDPLIGGYRWLTAEDEAVCATCGPRHGVVYRKGQVPDCPAHVMCRCVLSPVPLEDMPNV